MRKLIVFLFLCTATIAGAQTSNDNRSYSLKEVDEAPVPPDNISFADYFKKNFHPKEKATQPIKISFMIEKGGLLRDVKIFGEWPDDTKKEAVRVIKTLPKWKPGKKSGQPVRVLYTATLNP